MGTFGNLGATVTATSQKKSAHGTDNFVLILKVVTIPTNIFII